MRGALAVAAVAGACPASAQTLPGPAGSTSAAATASVTATTAAAAAATAATTPTADCSLLWQVTPVPPTAPGQAGHLRLALRFLAGPRSQTALHLPGGWSGLDEDPADGPPRLRAVPGEPGWRSLAHAPGETVQLQWRARPATAGDPGAQVQLTPTWWAFSGLGVLPLPDSADEPGAGTACIALQAPAGASAAGGGSRWASSHAVSDSPSLLIRLGPSPMPLAQRVQQALYVGGALEVARAPGVTAVLPASAPWLLQPAALARAGARALAAQQRHWSASAPAAPADTAAPWLVLALPAAAPSAALSSAPSSALSSAPSAALPSPPAVPPPAVPTATGTRPAGPSMAATPAVAAGAWHQALALQLPPGWTGDEPALERQLAPAVARAWLAGRFGPLAHAGRGDEALRAWFSEGWADFLAHRNLLRDGLWSADDYAAALNASIATYLADPARNLPTVQLAHLAAGDAPAAGAAQAARLQAQRGEWLALHWHQALRRAGQPGLDAALRRQLVPAAQARRDGPISAPLATHRLLATLRGVLQDQPLRDLQQHIDQGRPFDLGPDSLGPCFTAAPAAAGTAPAWRPVAGALQQADCQGWLGVGPLVDMQPVRLARAAAAADDCERVPVRGARAKAGRAGKPARAGARTTLRCHPAAAASAPAGSRAAVQAGSKAAKGGAKAGARSGGKAGAKAGTKSAGKVNSKTASQSATKAAASPRAARPRH